MQKTVLVADDNPAISEVLQMMLEDAGYGVEIQSHGQVVQQMQEPFPDLLLLDISLSGMDGRTICRHLKGQETTRHIPIILLSANKETSQIAGEVGADDFLVKPFEMEDLLALIAKLLNCA